jgi:hypothetical protein
MSSHRSFARNSARRFVIAETAKARMPQFAIASPLRKGEFSDQRGRDPGRLTFRRVIDEWALLLNEFVHALTQPQSQLNGETGSYLARVS